MLQGRAGTVLRALSALDIALWDRNARAAKLPLYKYLGAVRTDRVPAYASGGYYLPGKGPDGLADECGRWVEQGFKAVKIKVGRLADLGAEEARIAAARERIGPDVLLMQSSGVGNCINMLSLARTCRFPLPMLVTMRGEWAEFNPWQVPMGLIVEPVLRLCDMQVYRVEKPEDVAETVEAAIDLAFDGELAVAVLLGQRLIGRKQWVK